MEEIKEQKLLTQLNNIRSDKHIKFLAGKSLIEENISETCQPGELETEFQQKVSIEGERIPS